jgi:hypothetical protein
MRELEMSEKDDLIVDMYYNPKGKNLGKAMCDSVRRETYDYLVDKGSKLERTRILELFNIDGFGHKGNWTKRQVIQLFQELKAKISQDSDECRKEKKE